MPTNGSTILPPTGGGAGGADTALDNLTTTSINMSLIPNNDASLFLGASGLRWGGLYVVNILDNSGTPAIDITNRNLDDENGNRQLTWNSTVGVKIWNQLEFQAPGQSSSTFLTQAASPDMASAYEIIWPPAQGAATTVLENDGAGNLSWVANGGSTPTFASAKYNTSSQAIYGSLAPLQCSVAEFDNLTAYNPATGLFTVPAGQAGIYMVGFGVNGTTAMATFTDELMLLATLGQNSNANVTLISQLIYQVIGVALSPQTSAWTTISAAVGDTLSVQLETSTDFSLTGAGAANWVSFVRVG
jgi:hypothetical protein